MAVAAAGDRTTVTPESGITRAKTAATVKAEVSPVSS